jgi:opacity protein-like surface antigen
MKKQWIFAALSVVALATGAQAGPYHGGQHGAGRWPNWYVGVSGSLTYVDDTNVTSGLGNAGDVSFDSGYGVSGAVGYTPGPTGTLLDYARFEAEIGHRFNDTERFTSRGAVSNLSGELKSYSYMANAYFDFDTQTQVSPYVGVGAGLATVSLEAPSLAVNDDDSVFAYQFMAGLGWQPEFLLNTVLQVGYRYFGTSDPSFTNASGLTIEHEYGVHSMEAGARFRF